MSGSGGHTGYKLYWNTWVILMVLTVIMLAAEMRSEPRVLLVAVLLAAMLAKAGVIAGNFMHLRYEHKGLVLIVALTLLLSGLFLYGYLAADAMYILRHPAYPPE